MEARKLGMPSSSPALEPGLLPAAERRPWLDSSEWWLDPGRDERLLGRDGDLRLLADPS